MTARLALKVSGMHCPGCEGVIEDTLRAVPGVRSAKADYVAGMVSVAHGGTSEAAVREAIAKAGYACVARPAKRGARGTLRLLPGVAAGTGSAGRKGPSGCSCSAWGRCLC